MHNALYVKLLHMLPENRRLSSGSGGCLLCKKTPQAINECLAQKVKNLHVNMSVFCNPDLENRRSAVGVFEK